jgi:F420H(2)-dependent quinone reductase
MKMSPFAKAVIRTFSGLHASVFRVLGGRGFGNGNTLVLTTKGRKSGRNVSVPLLYVAEGDRLYIVASFGGNDEAPGWYRNLSAHPEVEVDMPERAGRYRARSLPNDEAAPIWPKLLAIYPAYASYQKKTTRLIPVVELTSLREVAR